MRTSRYTDEQLIEAVKNSVSVTGTMRLLGMKLAGGSHTHISRRIKRMGLDTSHHTGQVWNKGVKRPRKTPEQILVVIPQDSRRPHGNMLRRAMRQSGVEYKCKGDGCPNPEPVWAGKPIIFHVDHIDGNWLDNRIENLRFLCPNCHT